MHSGRILVSFVGLGTAILSVTGVIIWWRKRGAYSNEPDKHQADHLNSFLQGNAL